MTRAMGKPLPSLSTALIPRATYRLQFHGGFRFDDATALVPYLHALGISHLYASPYLRARAGSTHGYDIIDHAALNPEIGDEAAHRRLCEALAGHGMHQLLDVVPNHMGVLQADNGWWLDVLEHGPASEHARTFDIDWTPTAAEMPGQVLLPVLGAPYGEVLEAGELQLAYDAALPGFRVRYYDHGFPVDPRDYARILAAARPPTIADAEARREVEAIIEAFARLPAREDGAPEALHTRRRDQAILKRRLGELHDREPWAPAWLRACADAFNGVAGDPVSHDALDGLIGRQAWRLAFWRVASDEVNYRRFFDISTLAAVRMERPEVFEATHRLLLEWLADGRAAGLRIDHPDGLSDPAGYFATLQARYAATQHPPRALYLVIEKILAEHERWPEDWPVHGDTGYRFANLVNALFVDGRSAEAFDRLYADFAGGPVDYDAELYDAKRHIIASSLAADLHMLTEAVYRIAQGSRRTRDFTRNGLRAAIVELAAAMPVYRTYIGEAGVHDVDRQHLDWAAAAARRRAALPEDATLAYLCDLILGAPADPDAARRSARLAFVTRFQQFTAPVMAKAMEDTAFYRYHRLLSLNDVGSEPRQFGIGIAAFHGTNKARERHMPHCLLGSSTHDSKRSADVRARLDVLSELPQAWAEALAHWRELRLRMTTPVPGEPGLHPNDEYLLFQTLVGAWPPGAPDAAGLDALRERVQGALQKSLREAKQRSGWTRPDPVYEGVMTRTIDTLLGKLEPNPFLSDLRGFVARIAPYGYANSLALVALKLASPGVPDIYQGCEGWNFSLVDPDNRRPVDFAALRARLAELQAGWRGEAPAPGALAGLRERPEDGRVKMLVTWRLLQLRAAQPALFETGRYQPLETTGPAVEHVVSFARDLGPAWTITVAGRLLHTLLGAQGGSPFAGVRQAAWLDTAVRLPAGSPGAWRDVFTGRRVQAATDGEGHAALPVGELLLDLPVAQLVPA